jgi:hypothetical protein
MPVCAAPRFEQVKHRADEGRQAAAGSLSRTVLTRYQIVRGRPLSELPQGKRVDIRKHVKHVLSPEPAAVDAFLARGTEEAHQAFASAYRALLTARFHASRKPFDALAELARHHDVYLGCNCPTAKNPDVLRCHTVLALHFLHARYPTLDIRYPA